MIDDSWHVRSARVTRERLSAGGIVVRAHAGEPEQRELILAHAELIRHHTSELSRVTAYE